MFPLNLEVYQYLESSEKVTKKVKSGWIARVLRQKNCLNIGLENIAQEESFKRWYKKQDTSILSMIQHLPTVYFTILTTSFIGALAVNTIEKKNIWTY